MCSPFIQDSPILKLANDCSHFVTGYFGIIDASSSHIYHSALMLTPRKSMIWELYQSYVQPFIRVVHGVPTSWDLSTAAISYPFKIEPAVWSPCNKFIAVGATETMRVDILDSATLQRLQTLEVPLGEGKGSQGLVFSPDMQMLTCLGGYYRYLYLAAIPSEILIVSWDLQTGGVVNIIRRQNAPPSPRTIIRYSNNGRMIAVLHSFSQGATISIYDIVSGEFMHDAYHGTTFTYDMWAHGESLWFATNNGTGITIWGVKFTPGATCTEIETLSIPEDVIGGTLFCSGGLSHVQQAQSPLTSYRLARYNKATHSLLVWGIQDSKYLLQHVDIDEISSMTFSSSGFFFACSTRRGEVYLWRETVTGYTFHAKLPAITQNSQLLLSPNGRSIIAFRNSAVQLWHTKDIATSSSGILTQVPYHTGDFLLEFLPDRALVVIMWLKGDTVTVLDLNSGLLQLTIKTSMKNYGLRVVGNTIVVIGERDAITWSLVGVNFSPDSKMSVGDSIQTKIFEYNSSLKPMITAAISLDLCYIAILRKSISTLRLYIYDAPAGQYLTSRTVDGESPLWFTPGSPKICSTLRGKGAVVVNITEDGHLQGDQTVTPEALIEDRSWGCPWRISSGYQVTNDGWILGADRKRLLMLPPSWQSCVEQQVWNGNFFALLHSSLPEPVIVELEP